MKFNIDVKKKHFLAIFGSVLILASLFTVYAFGTNNPAYFGHSAAELDFSGVVIPTLTVNSICLNGLPCISSWSGGAQGPQGPQGPQGATGATGATGSQGPAGSAGNCVFGASHWVKVDASGANGYAECAANEMVTGFDRNKLNGDGFWIKCTQLIC